MFTDTPFRATKAETLDSFNSTGGKGIDSPDLPPHPDFQTIILNDLKTEGVVFNNI